MTSACTCVVNVVVLASRREPRLDAEQVLHHFLMSLNSSLSSSSTSRMFTRDLLVVTTDQILTSRGYRAQINPNMWLSLFLIVGKILKGQTPPNVTDVLMSTLLNLVVKFGTSQSGLLLKMKTKIQLFSEVVRREVAIKEHNIFRVHLDTCTELCTLLAIEDRSLACALTEATVNRLLDTVQSNQEYPDSIIKYCILAVIVHHPDSVEPHPPANETWHQILHRLSNMIRKIITNNHLRNETAEHKSYELTPDQVTLAIRVARHSKPNRSQSPEDIHTAKRARTSSAFQQILDDLQPNEESISQLQIAGAFVARYPQSVGVHELKQLIRFVVSIIEDFRSGSKLLLHCVHVLRASFDAIQHCGLKVCQVLQPEPLSVLVQAASKGVAAPEPEQGFALLTVLADFRLADSVAAQGFLQGMVTGGGSVVEQDCLVTLASLLRRYSVDLSCGVAGASLRIRIIEWLMAGVGADVDFKLFCRVLAAVLSKKPAESMAEARSDSGVKVGDFNAECRRLESAMQCAELWPRHSGARKSPFGRMNWRQDDLVTTAMIHLARSLLERMASLRCALEQRELTPERLDASELNSSVLVLAVARHLRRHLRILPDSGDVSDSAGALLQTLLRLLAASMAHGETRHSARCLDKLSDVLSSPDASAGDDLLRRSAWSQCLNYPPEFEHQNPSALNGSILGGTVRRRIADDAPPALNSTEEIRNRWLRFLVVLCCPSDPDEACRSCYLDMKKQFVERLEQDLASAITDSWSSAFMDLQLDVIRHLCRSNPPSLDSWTTLRLLEWLISLYDRYGADAQVLSRILAAIPALRRHCQRSRVDDLRLVKIIKEVEANLAEELYGAPVECAFYECLARLASASAGADWDGVVETLISGLHRPLLTTVAAVVHAIPHIFDDDSATPGLQDVAFRTLRRSALDAEAPEQRRAAAVVECFALVAIASARLERPAICAMLRFAVSNSVPEEAVRRALRFIAHQLDVDPESFAQSRFEDVLNCWLDDSGLEDFPHGVFFQDAGAGVAPVDLNEFIRSRADLILPAVLLKRGVAEAEQWSCSIGSGDAKQLMRSYAVEIAATVLPFDHRSLRNWSGIVDLLSEIGDSVLTAPEHAIRLLMRMISNVRAPADLLFPASAGVSLIETHRMPALDKESLVGFLKERRIPLSFSPTKDVLRFWIQLLHPVRMGLRYVDRQLGLLRLSLAVDVVCSIKDLTKDYFVDLLIVQLCHEIRGGAVTPDSAGRPESGHQIRTAAAIVLAGFLKLVLPEHAGIVGRHLIFIVGSCSALRHDSAGTSATASAADSVLKLLLTEHRAPLEAFIKRLPAESSAESGGMRSLGQEMENVVNLVRIGAADVNSVDELQRAIRKRPAELRALYERVADSGGSASDCVGSSVHRIICSLTRLASEQFNHQDHLLRRSLVQSIGSVLGLLGPSDLTTLILESDDDDGGGGGGADDAVDSMKRHSKGHVTLQLTMATLPHLVRMLVHSRDVQLIDKCFRVLAEVMETFPGRQFEALAKKYSWPELRLLRPFRPIRHNVPGHQSSSDSGGFIVDMERFRSFVCQQNLWLVPDGDDGAHPDWIIRITVNLIRSFDPHRSAGPLLHSMLSVCGERADLCSALLPLTIQCALNSGANIRQIASAHLNEALRRHGRHTTLSPHLKTMLSIVHHLRQQKPPPDSSGGGGGGSQHNLWLDVDYLDAARAAHTVSAHFTSVMYAEIHLDAPAEQVGDSGDVEDLMFQAYSETGEPDGCYSFQALLLSDPQWQERNCEMQRHWYQALELNDARVSAGVDPASRLRILGSLSRCGLYGTMSCVAAAAAAIDEYQLECAWRLADWSLVAGVVGDDEDASAGINSVIYRSLNALRQSHWSQLAELVERGRWSVMERMCSASLESCRNVYPWLTQLRLINQVEDMGAVLSSVVRSDGDFRPEEDYQIFNCDFYFQEPILALKTVVLRHLDVGGRRFGADALPQTLFRTCELARNSGNYHVANRCMAQLMELSADLGQQLRLETRLQKALTEWRMNNCESALCLLRSVQADLDKSVAPECGANQFRAKVLNLLGNWCHQSRLENPRTIISRYFRRSLQLSLQDGASDSVAEARKTLASYADSLYRDVQSHLESRHYETQQKLMKIRKDKAEQLGREKSSAAGSHGGGGGAADQEMRRASHFMTHETIQDENECETFQREKDAFLCEAVENYLISLADSGASAHDFDVRVSRFTSLWFDNPDNASVSKLVARWLPKIATRHFLSVLPQLAARLVNPKSKSAANPPADFANLLFELMFNCSVQHPQLTLPVILALAMNNKDKQLVRNRAAEEEAEEEERVVVAKKLLKKLKSTDDKLAKLCQQLENVSLFLIQFANQPADSNKSAKRIVPADLVKLKGYENVAVPTSHVPVAGSVAGIVGIVRFEDNYELVGGINAPKKIYCLGTDGVSRPLLLKGKDDLRQDAVMQQVFQAMNHFLRMDEEARKRRLRIRTYKVVPLSRRSGILQWCQNTMPLQVYLIGNYQVFLQFASSA